MVYDVSIVMPYFKKLNELKYSIEYNFIYFQQVKEVILVIDEYIENTNIFAFLHNYGINFKIFMNQDNKIEWCNPAVAINCGLRNAISEKLVVISPETILLENSLVELIENCDEKSFSTGRVIFMSKDEYYLNYTDSIWEGKVKRDKCLIGPVYFGSICCLKKHMDKINYYDESFSLKGWGGEDNEVRIRLKAINLEQKIVENAKFIHIESRQDYMDRLDTKKKSLRKPATKLYNNFKEIQVIGEDGNIFENSVKNFNEIIKYDLNKNILSNYHIILLTPCYNEEKYLKEFLINSSKFVDGIIMLDDGSDDNSWELMECPKLILKVKINRIEFNDLTNRNLLLKIFEEVLIKNGIKVDWFLWLDCDERLSSNIKHLQMIKEIILSPKFMKNLCYLPLYHKWNKECYNADYPYSTNGLQPKLRLIRHKLEECPYVLKSNKKLHFVLHPYNGDKFTLPLQIEHLAYETEELRIQKYLKYTNKYDTDKIQNYEHYLKKDISLKPYDDYIVLNSSKDFRDLFLDVINY